MPIVVSGSLSVAREPIYARFETLRETEGRVGRVPPTSGIRALLDAVVLPCRSAGGLTTGTSCATCGRLVGVVPSSDRRTVTVRCLWTDADPLCALMTPVSRLVALPPDAGAITAARLAADHGQEMLLVVRQSALVGIATRAQVEWASRGRQLGALATGAVWTATTAATLGHFAGVLRDRLADYAAVVDRGALRGVITRRDMTAIGWDRAD